MPKGLELGKSMKEINQMTVKTVGEIMKMCDFEKLKESWQEGAEEDNEN